MFVGLFQAEAATPGDEQRTISMAGVKARLGAIGKLREVSAMLQNSPALSPEQAACVGAAEHGAIRDVNILVNEVVSGMREEAAARSPAERAGETLEQLRAAADDRLNSAVEPIIENGMEQIRDCAN